MTTISQYNHLVDNTGNDSEGDHDNNIESQARLTETDNTKLKQPRFVRPPAQQRRGLTELEKLGVDMPQRVATALDKARKGELQIPLPESGTHTLETC